MAYQLSPKFSLVGEFIAVTNGRVNATIRSLTLFTYLGGPRYTYRAKQGKLAPYAQVLVGGAHSSGGLYSVENGYSGSSNGFAMTAGGGLDVNVNPHFGVRLFQADYLLTLLANHVDDRQSNFSLVLGWRSLQLRRALSELGAGSAGVPQRSDLAKQLAALCTPCIDLSRHSDNLSRRDVEIESA